MKIVSYYTPDDIYTPYAKQFEQDLIRLDLDYYIEPIELDGKWKARAKYRPTFLLRMLDKFNDDLLSLDVDCRVYSNPIINLYKSIAMYWFDMPGRAKEYLAGTMYIKNNQQARNIMSMWEAKCKLRDKRRSALILTEILLDNNIDIQEIPVNYVKCGCMPSINNVIIEHDNAAKLAREFLRIK